MKKSKLWMLVCVCAGLSVCGVSQAASRSFSGMVDNDTSAFVEVDIAALNAMSDENSLSTLTKHPGVKQLIDMLIKDFGEGEHDDFDYEKEYGITKEEFLTLFSGRMAAALLGLDTKEGADLSALMELAGDEKGDSFPLKLEHAVFADFSGTWEKLKSIAETTVKLSNEKLDKKQVASAAGDKDKNSKDAAPGDELFLIESRFDDIPVMLFESKNQKGERITVGRLALVNEVAVFVSEEERLRQTIERIKSGNTKNSLLMNSSYSEVVERFGQRCMDVYIRVDSTLTFLINEAGSAFEKADPEKKDSLSSLDMLGITKEALTNALKPETIRAIFASASIANDQTEIHYGALLAGYTGLAGFVQFGGNGVDVPDFVSDEYDVVNISTYDLEKAYDQLHAIITDISPMLAMMWQVSIVAPIQSFESLKTTSLEDFADPWLASLTKVNVARDNVEAIPEQFYVLKLRESDAVKNAIEEFAAMTKSITKKDFMDVVLYSFDCDESGFSAQLAFLKGRVISLAIIDDVYLALGITGSSLIDFGNLISSIKTGKGRNVQKIDVVADVLSELPKKDKVGFRFVRLADQIQALAIEQAKKLAENSGDTDKVTDIDFSDIKHVLVGATYRTDKYCVSVYKLREEVAE